MIIFVIISLLLLSIFLVFPKPKHILKKKYDAIVILGCPCNTNGTLTNTQIERLKQGYALYEAGFANKLIISGGSVHNSYMEAQAMAEYISQWIPVQDILLDTKARNTFENMKYTKALCNKEKLGNGDVIVVTSPSHIRRANFLAKKFFDHHAVIASSNKDGFVAYFSEYLRLWNTLYYELKLKK